MVCYFLNIILLKTIKFYIRPLAQNNWLNDGITLVDTEGKNNIKLPSISDFHSASQVVFVDSSGYLNFCANVFKSNYIHVS